MATLQRFLIMGGALVAFILCLCSIFTIRYRITRRHLKITWLWFIPIRFLALDNIRYLSPKRVRWAEKYYSTFNPRARWLVITKRRGWIKNVVITPPNPFVFKAEIERARQALNNDQ